MGLFSKKESVPELPPAPKLPELPTRNLEKRELPDLPSFPGGKRNDGLNREIVKSAVDDSSFDDELEVDLPKTDLPSHITVEERGIPKLPVKSAIPPMPEKPERRRVIELNASIENKQITKEIEPIFVRIDRFQSSQKNFTKIKEKISEIEKTLNKIKTVRAQEEKEINDWSTEIEKLKARLSEIDLDVFSQM